MKGIINNRTGLIAQTLNRVRPVYKHDCNKCKYMGSLITNKSGLVDVYNHVKQYQTGDVEVTYIVRYGNNGPDYISNSALYDFEDFVLSGCHAIYKDAIDAYKFTTNLQ